jgi:hypothetical protein
MYHSGAKTWPWTWVMSSTAADEAVGGLGVEEHEVVPEEMP